MREVKEEANFVAKQRELLFPNYGAPLANIASAKNAVLHLEGGCSIIDLGGGIGVTALGHNNEAINQALIKQSEKFWHSSNFATNSQTLALAEKLISHSFAEKIFFCNSGAEAIESSVKVARRYQHDRYGQQRYDLICFTGAFHGRTFLTMAMGASEEKCKGFGPMPTGIKRAKFNDIESVKAVITKSTAAVVIEPIQGEAGIHPCHKQFLQNLRQLCDATDTLLIFDEVQCGIGRTGHLFAYEGYQVVPDILASAKALGNGFPIGAVLTTSKIASALVPGSHGNTFGGNPLACAIAAKVLEIVADEYFLDSVREKSRHLKKRLNSMNHNLQIFSEVRCCGMWAGLQLASQFAGKQAEIIHECWQAGVAVLPAANSTLRLAPALTIELETLDEGVNILSSVLARHANQ